MAVCVCVCSCSLVPRDCEYHVTHPIGLSHGCLLVYFSYFNAHIPTALALDTNKEWTPSAEADSHSAIHRTSRILWNAKVHCHIYESTTDQMFPVQNLPRYFYSINLNIILPPKHRTSKWYFPFMFSTTTFLYISHVHHACYMSRPTHLIALKIFNEEYKLWSSSFYSLLQPPTNSSLLGGNLSTPCSQTPSIYVFPLMWETKRQVHTEEHIKLYCFLNFNL
jgi:hypothetical protein